MLEQHEQLYRNLNSKQRHIYNSVLSLVKKNEGGFFFVYGSGGCGKTYLWKAFITKLRSESKIVLPVASSGIASTLLPSGQTAHSRFKIPFKLYPDSTCSISHNSNIAELIKQTKLIIWDEAPMKNRNAFEALDRSLRDIMKVINPNRFHQSFGGITMLLRGDFRQIIHVVENEGRSDIVNTCITKSKLWDVCHLFLLRQNMRLHRGTSIPEQKQIEEFRKWVLAIGDGKLNLPGNQGSEFDQNIQIPNQYCLQSPESSIDDIINNTYDGLMESYKSKTYIGERAILAPTNQVVDQLNESILDKIPGESVVYYSSDSVQNDDTDNLINSAFPVEHLNSIKISGLPLHELRLKEGVVVMLMRNLSQTLGQCNGTRLIVKRCMKHTVQCEFISGNYVGSIHLIPRMDMCPSDTKFPFNLVRK